MEFCSFNFKNLLNKMLYFYDHYTFFLYLSFCEKVKQKGGSQNVHSALKLYFLF